MARRVAYREDRDTVLLGRLGCVHEVVSAGVFFAIGKEQDGTTDGLARYFLRRIVNRVVKGGTTMAMLERAQTRQALRVLRVLHGL